MRYWMCYNVLRVELIPDKIRRNLFKTFQFYQGRDFCRHSFNKRKIIAFIMKKQVFHFIRVSLFMMWRVISTSGKKKNKKDIHFIPNSWKRIYRVALVIFKNEKQQKREPWRSDVREIIFNLHTYELWWNCWIKSSFNRQTKFNFRISDKKLLAKEGNMRMPILAKQKWKEKHQKPICIVYRLQIWMSKYVALFLWYVCSHALLCAANDMRIWFRFIRKQIWNQKIFY